MKVLYYDCFAGISGDMNLGALIDLGVDAEFLKNELSRLPVHGYDLQIRKDSSKGITGTRVDVVIAGEDHDPNDEKDTKEGHYPRNDHGYAVDHDQHLHPDHSDDNVRPSHQESTSHPVHADDSSHGSYPAHNSYRDIRELIQSSQLADRVKSLSLAIFKVIAEAEAKIHNKEVDNVHFHEVGAIDSIVDIVGAAICIYSLEPDAVYCSAVELGGGFVHCAHGLYPVPAPATAEIVKEMPVKMGTVSYEATTPTGAAILAAIVNQFTDRTEFKVIKTGYGIGSKDDSIPNVLRVFLCETADTGNTGGMPSYVVECNIDDMNPEYYDYIIDLLFIAGAKDVYITPIIMKKSRPAVKLSVLCAPESEKLVNEVLLKETSTLGVRRYSVEKTMLERRMESVATRYGTIRVKSAFYKGKCIKSKPEYEDCIKIARDNNIPINEVYREVEHMTGKDHEHGGF